MNRNFTILSMVILVVLTSGCIGGGNGGTESDESVEIHELSVSDSQIYSGTPVDVRMEVENSGKLDAVTNVGQQGSNVMTDHCPDVFNIKPGDFQVGHNDQKVTGQNNVYSMKPGQGLTMQWELNQQGQVPLYGQKCDLKFQVPFNYSVSAYRQVQVKSSQDIQGSDLIWESSSGPLTLAIETLGGTGDEGKATFIEGQDDEMNVLLQFQNPTETEYNKGVTDINEESLWIAMKRGDGSILFNETFEYKSGSKLKCSTSGRCVIVAQGGRMEWISKTGSNSDTKCEIDTGKPIRILEGKSRVIKCDIDLTKYNFQDPSEVLEIQSRVKYTYIKDAGTKRIKVESRG